MFTDLQWCFKVAQDNISEVVREVYQVFVDEFGDKFIVTPNIKVQLRSIAKAFLSHDIFTMLLGLLRGSFSSSYWLLLMQTINLSD